MPQKTTIYLPDELKAAVERLARQRGSSEADVIRAALTDAVAQTRPTAGFLDAEPFAERVDDLLEGFGSR